MSLIFVGALSGCAIVAAFVGIFRKRKSARTQRRQRCHGAPLTDIEFLTNEEIVEDWHEEFYDNDDQYIMTEVDLS